MPNKELKKGYALIQIEMNNMTFAEITKMVEHCKKNPSGLITTVTIGDQTFEA